MADPAVSQPPLNADDTKSAADGSSTSTDSADDGSVATYRHQVLEPNKIKVYDAPVSQELPEGLLDLIQECSDNLDRFDHVIESLYPLPTEESEEADTMSNLLEMLANVMHEQSISRQTNVLFQNQDQDQDQSPPLKTTSEADGQYPLPVARTALASGFSQSAFSPKELTTMPTRIICTSDGSPQPEDAHVSHDSIYAPFMSFEYVDGQSMSQIDTAQNQCALNGTWCLRAWQSLSNQIPPEQTDFPQPTAFSCSLDNDAAVINQHWYDESQNYCMAPVCLFDLYEEDHVGLLLAWVEAIEKWSMNELLPILKYVLEDVPTTILTPPDTPLSDSFTIGTLKVRQEGDEDTLSCSFETNSTDDPEQKDDNDDHKSYSSESSSQRFNSATATPIAVNFPEDTLHTRPTISTTKWETYHSYPKRGRERFRPTSSRQVSEMSTSQSQAQVAKWRTLSEHATVEIHKLQNQLLNKTIESQTLIKSLEDEVQYYRELSETLRTELEKSKAQINTLEHESISQRDRVPTSPSSSPVPIGSTLTTSDEPVSQSTPASLNLSRSTPILAPAPSSHQMPLHDSGLKDNIEVDPNSKSHRRRRSSILIVPPSPYRASLFLTLPESLISAHTDYDTATPEPATHDALD